MARRPTWLLCACLLAVLLPAAAGGVGIPNSAQIGSTRVGTTDNDWRIWARRSDGTLVTVHRNSSPWQWTALGTGGSNINTAGVTTAWWLDGTTRHERAYFVGVDGNLYEYAMTNGGSGTWTAIGPPAAHTLTGHVTALTGSVSGNRYVVVAATTTDGDLHRVIKNITTGSVWTWALHGTGFSTGRPLTSTVSPDGTIWSFFAVKTTNTVSMMRYNPSVGWTDTNVGSPSGVSVCYSLDAAQGQLSSTEFRLILFCTRVDTTEDRVRYAYTTSATSTSFTWTYATLPGGTIVDAIGNTLGAVDRPAGGSNYAIDGWVLGNNDHVYLLTKNAGTAMTVTDRGMTGEANSFTDGGLAAVRVGTNTYSRVVFNGSLNTADYLYTRAGDDGATWSWEALGAGEQVHQISGTGTPHTEAMIAEWNGKMIAASIHRPGPNPTDYAEVQSAWSSNDGYTWGAQTVRDKNGMQYTTDPTVVFTDAGKAYVVILGVSFPTGLCTETWNSSKIYYQTTTDGSTYSSPVNIFTGTTLDHEWVGIDQSRSPDRLHFAWSNLTANTVEYRYLDDGGSFGAVRTLAYGYGPPTLAVAPDGSVYVAWLNGSVWVCKLRSDLTDCDHTPLALTGDLQVSTSDVLVGSQYIRAKHSWSIQASPVTANRLYYLFQKLEADGDQKDVYLSTGTYDPVARTWSWGTPYAVTVTNDDKDQFNPALNVHLGGGGYMTLNPSWYDRREDCAGGSNWCIRRKRSYSNTGTGFLYTQDSQTGALTDPTLLPYHCRYGTAQLFIGDFQEGLGVKLHSHHIWSSAPIGSPGETGIITQGFLSASGFYY